MIDIENEIFTEVKKALQKAYPKITCEGEESISPPTFPYVSFVESDNAINKRTLDSSGIEKYARVSYVANVYSAKATGKKAEAKAILDTIDKIMVGYGFARQSSKTIATDDPSLHRRVARYRANISNDNTIYRG